MSGPTMSGCKCCVYERSIENARRWHCPSVVLENEKKNNDDDHRNGDSDQKPKAPISQTNNLKRLVIDKASSNIHSLKYVLESLWKSMCGRFFREISILEFD